MRGCIDHLQGWVRPPYVQQPVIVALKAARYPMTLSEVVEAADVAYRPANRVLYRLVKKGMVRRERLLLQRHGFCRKTWQVVPNGARRRLFVYSWSGDVST